MIWLSSGMERERERERVGEETTKIGKERKGEREKE